MALYLDHLVLKVDDLEKAQSNFSKLGFTVSAGGVHGGGLSKNALIHFEDDTFIELFSLTKGIKSSFLKGLKGSKIFKQYQYSKKWGLAYRFYSRCLELPDGVTDVCFLSDDFNTECDRINNEGLFLTKTIKGKRRKPDGSKAVWQMSAPFINEMPFLRSAYSPPAEIANEMKTHENGAKGIESLKIMALDYKDMTSKYQLFLNAAPTVSEKEPGQKSIFKLKSSSLEVIKSSDHKDLKIQLQGKGLGMYGITLKQDDPKQNQFDANLLHGLVILND
ncbi:MAG: VOC family protein [Cyclobacteriaceae bacterium]